MKMNRRSRKQRLVSEINITPFTDVILVLLVIFMITTPLITQLNIKINLPDAKNGVPPESMRQAQADITITREGMIYLDGKFVTRKELKEQLIIMHQKSSDLMVTMRSDKFVRFEVIVDVLDQLNELGITKVNIAAMAEQ
jgi:biopolymer transport protein TolR